MHHTLVTFCAWLELTSFSRLLQDTDWVIPAVQTIHILAIAAVIAATLMLDLRILGLSGLDQSLDQAASRSLGVTWKALPVLLASGVLMICAEPARALQNPAFQLKMLLLLATVLLSVGFQRHLRADAGYWEASPARRRTAVAFVAITLSLWVAVLFCGRWIAYMVSR